VRYGGGWIVYDRCKRAIVVEEEQRVLGNRGHCVVVLEVVRSG